jgi:hypothetical protein
MIEEVRVVTNVNTEKSHLGPDAPVRAPSIAHLALDFDLCYRRDLLLRIRQPRQPEGGDFA